MLRKYFNFDSYDMYIKYVKKQKIVTYYYVT